MHALDRMNAIPGKLIVSCIQERMFDERKIQLHLLRLDLIHPQISGNKWFKLKYSLQEAIDKKYRQVVSFGGAYSNHLHALAYAGKQFNIKTVGIIRGEDMNNPTLHDCKEWGMELRFLSRSEYRKKSDPDFLQWIHQQFPDAYLIPEGGNNEAGRRGCREILDGIDCHHYTHIACAVGTGATFSGIVDAAHPSNRVLGFCALKNGSYLENEIKQQTTNRNWNMVHEFHEGGFAKRSDRLLHFIKAFKISQSIELDFVYTGKMMMGLFEMIQRGDFTSGSSLLAIHTGGLQGNRSLPFAIV